MKHRHYFILVLFLLTVQLAQNSHAAVQHQSGKELIRGNSGEPQTLDPHLMQGPQEGWIAYDLFEGLVTYDDQGILIPGQASSWSVSEDSKHWVFQIRDHLQWSDGVALTAKDFAFSLQRLASPETAAAYGWFLQTMDVANATDIINGSKPPSSLGVKATDNNTLVLTLNQPVSYLPELMAFYGFLPVPKHVIESKGKKWTMPENMVSNGPFKLKEWRLNEKVTAVKNTKYWDQDNVKLDSVVYITAGDELALFRTGKLHLTNSVKIEHESWARRHVPDQVKTEPWMSVGLVFLNLKASPLKDVRNRRALALALDRESSASTPALGTCNTAWQVVPPHFEHFQPNRDALLSQPFKTRADKARALVSDMKSLTLSYSTSNPRAKIMAIITASDWQKQLGIKVHLQGYEEKQYHEQLNKGNYEATVLQWVGPFKDPASLLNIFHSNNASNRSFYSNPNYDELLNLARSLPTSTPEKMHLYAKAEELLMQDAPVIPMVHHKNVRLVSPLVKGYSGKNPMGRVYSKHLSLEHTQP